MQAATIRTFKDYGPYFSAEKDTVVVGSLGSLIYIVRQAMEERMDVIAVFHDDDCAGTWQREVEVEPDGEGGLMPVHDGYTLYRQHHCPRSFDHFIAPVV